MRFSCNGCRALRKGCADDCTIRPCLQWIPSPQSQANATLFLAKFYGRAGLLNLINAGPENQRPAIFRSLLYEACGRIVNPIYGSVGLMWSRSWHLCDAAVEAVLNGAPIMQISSEEALSSAGPPLKVCDIRHVPKDENSAVSDQLHKLECRPRFKRSAGKRKAKAGPPPTEQETFWGDKESSRLNVSWWSNTEFDSGEGDSISVETVEPCLVAAEEPADGNNVELALTLGLARRPMKLDSAIKSCDTDAFRVQVHLGL